MKTKKIAYCSLFAIFIAVASQISIPLQPVPIHMAVLAVLLAGAFLGSKSGTISVVVYILLGCVGVPVFASLRGGLNVLMGYTGGYIIGYIFISFITGFISERTSNSIFIFIAMTVGVMICYSFGTLWYCFVTNTSAFAALSTCVIPFIPGDVIKIFTASLIYRKFKKYI